MTKRRLRLTHRMQRSVLTDMLPFECPPTFSNRGFYKFLRMHLVEISGGKLTWVADGEKLDVTMKVLFGFKSYSEISAINVIEFGKALSRRSIDVKHCKFTTIPFNFRVAHKTDGRTLSVVHPRNQVDVASFYANFASSITYYGSRGEFSIRQPVSVSRYSYVKDKLHEQKLDRKPEGVEQQDKEYEQLGSYFVNRKYSNIHKFFESYKYHRCEKKYNGLVQLDISKCFDSIYTHTLSWAITGKAQTKFHLESCGLTFADRFDLIMRNLNHGETNGIVIGPEFSRVFAELVLQSVDKELQQTLYTDAKLIHKRQYEIFRYVDDYFIFYDEQSTQLKIRETLQEVLARTRLSVNSSKIHEYAKPIITEITIAKELISSLLDADINPHSEPSEAEDQSSKIVFSCIINSNRLIIRYKTIIKLSKVDYGDLLNYTLAILERKCQLILSCFSASDQLLASQKNLVRALLSLAEFSFFLYSASPKVNHTIRLCRIISTAVIYLNQNAIPFDLKHLLYKYLHDNIWQQVEKNKLTSHREVENLYLLVSLSSIGREYLLPEAALLKYLDVEPDENGFFKRNGYLSHFSITVMLSYIKSKVRYANLRKFLETHALEKLAEKAAHCPNDSEALLLLLDLNVCPYVSEAAKQDIAGMFGLDENDTKTLRNSNAQWFTAWGDNFRIEEELDAKRSREVY